MPESDRGRKRKTRLIVGGVIAAATIALFGLVAVGLFSQAGYQQYAERHSREHADYAGEKARQTCATVPVVELPNCVSKAHTEAKLEQASYEHDQADLVAQRKAALWAEMMGIAALLGMGLSAVGVALVWITFRETRRQANLAETQLAHTLHAVRPYLTPKSETVEFRPGETPPVVVWLKFMNTGGTAAHGLLLTANSVFRNFEAKKIRTLIPGRWPHGSVGREQPVDIEYKVYLSPADFAALESGMGEVRIIFRGVYSNEFGEDWVYETNLSVTKASIASGLVYTNDLQQHRAVKEDEPEASHQPALDLKGGG